MNPKKWPATRIVMQPPAKLIPHPHNSRQHSEEQVQQVMNSMRHWGFTIPVLVDESNTIIAGHCRVRAAEGLELDQIPTMVARGWSQEQVRAYIIADNRLSELGTWNPEMLRDEINFLNDADFTLPLLGFDDVQIEAHLNDLDDNLFEISGAETTNTKPHNTPTKTQEGYAVFSVVLPVAHRNAVNQTIRAYMEANDIPSMGDAFVKMMEAFDG